jgi:hypothetical protein
MEKTGYDIKDSMCKQPDHVSLGYIDLIISCGRQYAELDFCVFSTAMSLLFLGSSSIHQTFLAILHRANGLFGLIDIEDDEFPILGHQDSTVNLADWGKFLVEGTYDVDVDKLATEIQTQIADLTDSQ